MKAWLVSSSVLILAFIILRALFKKRISPSLRYALWLPVLLRLLLPFNIGESAVSVLNYIPSIELSEPAPVQDEAALLPFGEETPFSPYNDELTAGEQSQAVLDSTGATKPEIGLKDLIFPLYLTGAALVFSALLLSNLRFSSSLRKSRRDAGSFMGLPVYKSAALDSPCLFGLLRPAIYLSEDVDDNSCKHVLMHEQAHYRQKDHVWAWLRGVALALHWYNPLVWLAAKLSKQDSELSCDEKVIASIDSAERISYGKTLISLSCVSGKPLLCAVAPLSSKGRALKERVEYVAKRPGTFLGSMVLVLVAALIVSGCTFTDKKDSEPVSPEISAEAPATEMPVAEIAETAPPLVTPTPNPFIQMPYAAALLDRNGADITADNFPFYSDAVSAFSDYLGPGGTVRLTIDLDLQKEAERIIAEKLSTLEAQNKAACLVAIDVNTGAPLAMTMTSEKLDPLKVSFSPYDIFIPCTIITGLGENVISTDDYIECKGVFDRYEADGLSLECWQFMPDPYGYRHYHPDEDVVGAIRDYCWYYAYAVGNDCGIDAMESYAHKLGLGVESGIELASSRGLMAGREAASQLGVFWNIGHTLEASIGKTISAFTPLQLAQYCATIANNGKRYSASIAYEISDSSGNVLYNYTPQLLGQVDGLLADEWDAVKKGLYENLHFGPNPNYDLAEKMKEQLGHWRCAGIYTSPVSNPSGADIFISYAPYHDPQIAVAVVTFSEAGHAAAREIAYELIAAYKNMQ